MIATLQQQVSTMLLQQQGSRIEAAKPQVFSGRIEEVSVFVNAACLYIRMKIAEEVAATQVAWVLSYMQGGVVEAWKNNLLDELAKGESEVELVEQLFTKIRDNFGETLEEEREIKQLSKGEGPATSIYRNLKRSPGGAVIREDLSLKNLRED